MYLHQLGAVGVDEEETPVSAHLVKYTHFGNQTHT